MEPKTPPFQASEITAGCTLLLQNAMQTSDSYLERGNLSTIAHRFHQRPNSTKPNVRRRFNWHF
jgi:hypothetical protein